jgi:hypothetical protein
MVFLSYRVVYMEYDLALILQWPLGVGTFIPCVIEPTINSSIDSFTILTTNIEHSRSHFRDKEDFLPGVHKFREFVYQSILFSLYSR